MDGLFGRWSGRFLAHVLLSRHERQQRLDADDVLCSCPLPDSPADQARFHVGNRDIHRAGRAGAFLTKINAVVMPMALLLALMISEKAPWRAKLMRAGALGTVMLAIVAPWLNRNQWLSGTSIYMAIFLPKGSS